MSSLAIALAEAPEVRQDELSERVLDAAFEQFRRLGIRRSSMDDVARRAGVGRATVFRKFESKDGLVSALVLREARDVLETARSAMEELDAVEDRIVEGFVVCFTTARRHPVLNSLLDTEPEAILPLLTTCGGPAIGLGTAVIAQGLGSQGADKHLRQVAELLARVGLSLLLTPSQLFALDTDAQIRAFARRHLVAMVAEAGA